MNKYKYEEIEIGHKENFTVTVTEEMMEKFRDITGDINPLHNDEEYASSLGHPGRVAYGMLTGSFLSTLAGVYLPGKRSLIQEVKLKFAKPVYIGDTRRDEEAARIAGIPFIHARYGFGDAERPEGMINDIAELPGLLREMDL